MAITWSLLCDMHSIFYSMDTILDFEMQIYQMTYQMDIRIH